MSEVSQNWSCSWCSFSNHPDLVLCEICEREKTVINQNSIPVSSSSSDKVSDMNATADNSLEVERAVFQMDDCSCTSGIMELLKKVLLQNRMTFSLSWPYCSHFSQRNSFGASWSCGYRNVQMIASSLMQIPVYREKLFSGKGRMPNIRIIQQWIEEAWKEGFDVEVRNSIMLLYAC